ncbi:hypothetical protein BWQ96_07904 [Gracilariopsis chorda]|uniref:Uncharacterized protein n=1 Tax=Gracilariopsis chorda TaxID=448386 RepID=A0A2V3IJV8_9FLOR|nr:hypothetical protein BWQ96_07904 [Gracilariopsis chorda]|eukprot:PXF42384.1 hypothetical protein BWQ96_07904 [Gracilariopsis chorda]
MPAELAQDVNRVSIAKRVCLSTAWTIFGLVFFYLVMVFFSSIAKGIVLDRVPQNGWARSASRHTGAVTAPIFSLFLMTSPSSLWSLFLAVMVACAHFCHFVIITSDLRVYVDDLIVRTMFRIETTHPIFRLLPLKTAHVVGSIGFVAMLIISLERCYGPSLGKREARLPFITRASSAWIWAVFNLFFVDRLVSAVLAKKDRDQILYPIVFISILGIGALVCLIRETRWDQRHKIEPHKKTQ